MNTPLTAGQRALLAAELEQRQREIEQSLKAHEGSEGRIAHARETFQEVGDEAALDAERDLDQALGERLHAALRDVRAAMARVQAEDFGVCGDCGCDIPFERLRLSPQALRCVPCQSRQEHQAMPTL